VTNTENLQDALNAAKENISTLALERDRLKLELQRLRERSSVELAEAKVAEARLQRTNNELTIKANRLEAEVSHLRTEVDWHLSARRDLVRALAELAKAHDLEAGS